MTTCQTKIKDQNIIVVLLKPTSWVVPDNTRSPQGSRSSTGTRTGPTAVMPWPLASKPDAAGGAGDVEATMAADAASATVKVARRINGSRNISRGTSESSPRISRNNSSISPGTSNISYRSRNSSTSGISHDISRSSPHSIQEDGVHHAFVWCGQHGHFLSECRAVPPTRFPDPYAGAQALTCSYSEDYAIWERSSTITVSPRAAGPAWTVRSVRVVLELLQRTGHPGAICATRQVARTE